MSARLVVIAGPDQGQAFPLSGGAPLLVGRGRTATVRLADPHVSRSHCQVKFEGGQVVVEDLDSVSGIFINDARVRTHAMRPGEVLRVGSTLLRLEAEDITDQATILPTAGSPLAREVAAKLARPAPKPSMPVPAATAPIALPARQPLQNLVGQPLAHFHVGPVISPGKTGVVFRATDTRDSREVALKVFFPDFSRDEEEMQRFLRAMKTVLPLRHPHLVTVQAAGRSGPLCWVSMELVEGVSLAPALRHAATGAGDWRVACRAVLHIARVLAYLHGQPIFHRNITPNNILLSTTDGTIKLGDMMTAKAQEGKLARQVTAAGEILGEVRYLSPEQTVNASAGDGRADLYSLGAVAYAVLTGRPPLEGKSPVETILKIRQAAPAPLRQSLPTLPTLFEGAVMKLLAKKPEERFQSAGELLGCLSPLAASVS